jgi:hypothetical protein
VHTPNPHRATTPPRPDEAPGSLRRERRWIPVIAVAVVIVVLVSGGYVTAAALSTPAGPPLSIGGVATVTPLSGWRFVKRVSEGGVPGLVITRGNGNLEVLAGPFDRSAEALARLYATQVLQPQASQLQVSTSFDRVTVASGLPGVRFGYIGVFDQSGVPIEGEVTVVVSPGGTGAVFDGWSPEGDLQYVVGDIETMVREATLAS